MHGDEVVGVALGLLSVTNGCPAYLETVPTMDGVISLPATGWAGGRGRKHDLLLSELVVHIGVGEAISPA